MFDERQSSLNQLGYLLAEASRTVVFVVGAGVSKPAGVPLWPELQGHLKKIAISFINKNESSPAERNRKLHEIQEIADPWNLGDLLEQTIPQEAFDREIRKLLTPSTDCSTYRQLWDFSPSGMVSFNLDPIARTVLSGTADQYATAIDTLRYERFLLLSRPFLFQVHGSLDVKKSWVLGARSRNRLLKTSHYRNFVRALLSTRRLVIVGMRPDDVAFQTLLIDDFRTDITRGVSHFWICPNPNADTRRWAESFNVSLIEYTPATDKHSEVNEILRKLTTFHPREPEVLAAYTGPTISIDELPADSDLRICTVEDIRHRLNAAIKGLEERDEGAEYHKKLRSVFSNYSGSLRMAWHVQPRSEYETLWGTKVIQRVGGGAFGGVWLAEDAVDGRQVAVKILHENVLQDKDFLEAFRRGVRAMGILSKANVPGMVRFINAYDVPACVFMEYVQGVDFEEAVDSQQLSTLSEIVGVVLRVAETVLRGHELDQQVLHRDLKPSNVMIRNFWDPDRENEVVVLDFDLSWYEGAFGKSMVSSAINNYIAPEQLLSRRSSFSSRHTAVDVFGVGMLLYFGASKAQPPLNVQERADFFKYVFTNISDSWKDLPPGIATYLALTIIDATYTDQSCRCSMPTLISRLNTVHSALTRKTVDMPSFLGNVLIAAELEQNGWRVEYDLNSLGRIEVRRRSAVVVISSNTVNANEEIEIALTFSPTEETPRGEDKKKYLQPKFDAAEAALRKHNFFSVKKYIYTGGALTLIATARARSLSFDEFDRLATVILDSTARLIFS